MFGFHVYKKSRPLDAAVSADINSANELSAAAGADLQFNSAQIFVMGPQNKNINVTEEEIKNIAASKTAIVVHSAYVNNPWNQGPASLIREMKISAAAGARGIITHLAAATNDKLAEVLTAIDNGLNDNEKQQILYLEINATRANVNSFETPEKITALFNKISQLKLKLTCGLCIDTAHLSSCGVNLRTRAQFDTWISGIPDIPIMFHLNDSAAAVGSGKDIHACLTYGNIWGEIPIEDSGLGALIDFVRAKSSICILERDSELLKYDFNVLFKY